MSKALAAPVVALAALGTPCDALVLPSPTNIYSNAIAAVRYTLGPSMSLTDALTSSSQSLIGEAEAAKGGIAKLDAPTWHKAADMLDECITEASGMSGLWEQTALSLQEAAADAREIAFAISGVATPEILQTDEQAAKAAWLSKLDTPAFGKAASALSEVVAVATKIHDLASQCDKGDQVACTNLSNEDKAKAAWLSKCDVPNWGAAAQATSHIVEVAAMSPNQDAAKAAWLSKLDAPTWGKAASALTSVVAEAAQMADLSAKCDSGDKVACVHLTNEDEAKRAWLSKLDVPTWGQVASTVSEAAAAATITQVKDDEAAKAAWLSKLDEPSWVSPGAGGLTDPSWGVGKVVPTEPVSSPVGFVTPSDEAAAKAAWLSKLDLPTTPNNEASAKRAWLSKLDQPTWGAAASVLTEAAKIADLSAQCDEGVEVACSQVSSEDAAKAAWLSKLDVPNWGAAAQVVNDIIEVTNMNPSADAAKAAWLAKLDPPTWGKAAAAITEVVSEAAQIADLSAKCESGEQVACKHLSNEDKAKAAWLSKLDLPAWGQVAATVSAGAVATLGAGTHAAKAAWLSKIEDNQPTWIGHGAAAVGKVVPTAAPVVAAPVSAEASAKAAWLSKLDQPTWGAAASVLTEAAVIADLSAQCESGEVTACTSLSREDEAKAAWLSKLDVPDWGAAAQVVNDIAALKPNEDAAKAAWLSKLDAPTWGQAASALSNVVTAAAEMADLSAKCESGEQKACTSLSNEDAAKRAWLSKLDLPTWGQVAAEVSAGAVAAVAGESAAKAAWLSKIEDNQPAWVSKMQGAAGKVVPTASVPEPVVVAASSDEAAAKAAWLSKLDVPIAPTSEASAKRAWLSKLDQPTWGAAASALYEAASIADLSAQCDEGVQTACSQVSGEDAAKAAWLSKLDVPSWGAAAQVVNDILEVTNLNPSEDAAKAAWLAKLDAPTWGQAASALTEVVAEAAQMADLTAKCESGEQKACTNLSNEDKAKREWLSKLDVPAWGQVAATVSSGAVAVAGEVDAKAAWLSKIEDNTPAWLSKIGRSSTVGKVVPTGRDSAAVKESLFLARQKSELAITELDTMVRIIKDIKTLVEN